MRENRKPPRGREDDDRTDPRAVAVEHPTQDEGRGEVPPHRRLLDARNCTTARLLSPLFLHRCHVSGSVVQPLVAAVVVAAAGRGRVACRGSYKDAFEAHCLGCG